MRYAPTMRSVKEAAELRRIFEKVIIRRIKKRNIKVAVMLSGGMDSTSAALAVASAGYKVHAYTFQIGDNQSYDSKWAQNTARIMGWQWTLIKIPEKTSDIVKMWPTLYKDLGCRKKITFECAWPFLYVYPLIKEKFVISGFGGDLHYALSRKSSKLGIKKGADPEIFNKLRDPWFKKWFAGGMKKVLTPEYHGGVMYQHYQLQKKYGLVEVLPYLEKPVFDWFRKFTWDELNTPRQKHHPAAMYPEMMQYVGHRNQKSYNVAAKIGDHFAKLLTTPVNFRKRKRTLDMYADWRRYPDECAKVIAKIEKKYGKPKFKLDIASEPNLTE